MSLVMGWARETQDGPGGHGMGQGVMVWARGTQERLGDIGWARGTWDGSVGHGVGHGDMRHARGTWDGLGGTQDVPGEHRTGQGDTESSSHKGQMSPHPSLPLAPCALSAHQLWLEAP